MIRHFPHSLLLASSLLASAGIAAAAPNGKAPSASYVVATPKVTQELTVAPKGKKAVSFKLNLSGSCKRTVTGVAKLKSGDAESDEDETGTSYFVDEYWFKAKDGCQLILRLQADDRQRAIIKHADCKASCNPVEDLMLRTDATTTAAAKTKPTK